MKERMAETIISMLCGRGGFDDWWYNIEEETQQEIINEMVKIITLITKDHENK